MNTKFFLGVREVIAIILGTLAFFALSALQISLYNRGSVVFGSYIYMPSVMLAMLAAVFGPMVGAVAGTAGQLLACILIYNEVQPVDLVIVFFSGIIIGFFAEDFGILKGDFKPDKMCFFNVLHFLTCIMNIVLMRPIMYLIFRHYDYRESLVSAVKVCIGTELAVLIPGTFVLWVISKAVHKYARMVIPKRNTRR